VRVQVPQGKASDFFWLCTPPPLQAKTRQEEELREWERQRAKQTWKAGGALRGQGVMTVAELEVREGKRGRALIDLLSGQWM